MFGNWCLSTKPVSRMNDSWSVLRSLFSGIKCLIAYSSMFIDSEVCQVMGCAHVLFVIPNHNFCMKIDFRTHNISPQA